MRYGKWYGVILLAENKKQFLIPRGFAHGFYHPNDEGGLAWNNPQIGIQWPEVQGEYKGNANVEGYTFTDGTALNLSEKDQRWMGLKETFKF